MRLDISAAVLTAAIVAGCGFSSPVSAAQDHYCLQGRQWGYPGNCQFSTYQQCMATASGTDSSCGINPRYAFERQQRGDRRRY
jgi:hypothetical protein